MHNGNQWDVLLKCMRLLVISRDLLLCKSSIWRGNLLRVWPWEFHVSKEEIPVILHWEFLRNLRFARISKNGRGKWSTHSCHLHGAKHGKSKVSKLLHPHRRASPSRVPDVTLLRKRLRSVRSPITGRHFECFSEDELRRLKRRVGPLRFGFTTPLGWDVDLRSENCFAHVTWRSSS